MIVSEKGEQLSVLLKFLAAELDIPPELDHELTEAYREVAEWLREDGESRFRVGAEVYPQGSRRLGTMVRPVNEVDEYDVDLVFRRDLARTSTTQRELKAAVGEQLERFVEWKKAADRGDPPVLREGGRCWTLRYPRFHLDLLPAIPNDEPVCAPESILITDRDVRRWQVSNPRGYATWFKQRTMKSLLAERTLLAKSRGVEVEEIPEDEVKTPLHRAVQILKRHRDVRFDGDPDDKPASIVITTLAALAYDSERDLYEAVSGVFRRLTDGIEERDGVLWIANPVDAEENFADRWRERPERAAAFFRWAEQAREDLAQVSRVDGLHEVTKSLTSAFGAPATNRAVTRLAESARAQREEGRLLISGTGTLGNHGRRPVRDHTFYGS